MVIKCSWVSPVAESDESELLRDCSALFSTPKHDLLLPPMAIIHQLLTIQLFPTQLDHLQVATSPVTVLRDLAACKIHIPFVIAAVRLTLFNIYHAYAKIPTPTVYCGIVKVLGALFTFARMSVFRSLHSIKST
jgi:hypothetical protein